MLHLYIFSLKFYNLFYNLNYQRLKNSYNIYHILFLTAKNYKIQNVNNDKVIPQDMEYPYIILLLKIVED